jgi:predicted HAD superfamily phosphohydrolase YqeG
VRLTPYRYFQARAESTSCLEGTRWSHAARDLDNLSCRDSDAIPQTPEFGDSLGSGFTVCLVSNNCMSVSPVVMNLARLWPGRQAVAIRLLRALKLVASTRKRAAIVGDQLFTDVLGGKLLGIMTIMVLPLSASDLPHTLLLRRVEKVLLAGRQPE